MPSTKFKYKQLHIHGNGPINEGIARSREGTVSIEVQGYNFLDIPPSTEYRHFLNILKLLVSQAMTQNWYTSSLKPEDMLLV